MAIIYSALYFWKLYTCIIFYDLLKSGIVGPNVHALLMEIPASSGQVEELLHRLYVYLSKRSELTEYKMDFLNILWLKSKSFK